MTQDKLARRLRVLRAERGLSLTEAAERIGVTRDTLSEIERGKRHPYVPTLTKIAAGYGVPVEGLLEEPALAGKVEAPEAGHIMWVGPHTYHIPAELTEEGLVGETHRTLVQTIGEDVPEAPDLLREHVRHAYLDTPVNELVEEAGQMDVAGVRERMFELRDEYEWLRSYYYKTYRSERATSRGRMRYTDRQRQLSSCFWRRLKALGKAANEKASHLPPEEHRQIVAEIQEELDFLTAEAEV